VLNIIAVKLTFLKYKSSCSPLQFCLLRNRSGIQRPQRSDDRSEPPRSNLVVPLSRTRAASRSSKNLTVAGNCSKKRTVTTVSEKQAVSQAIRKRTLSPCEGSEAAEECARRKSLSAQAYRKQSEQYVQRGRSRKLVRAQSRLIVKEKPVQPKRRKL
jgi:hypothetical protein